MRHSYPKAINLLLAGTLVLTLARAITLPYLVIYLSSAFGLQVSDIGLVIGSSMILGSLLSLYGGFLVDRTPSYRLILACCALFTLGFIGAFGAHQLWLFYLCLVMVNLAYAVIDIAIKAGFAQRLSVEQRSEAFSIKYTLTNIGYAVGPFLGAGLARLDISLPFLISAALGAGFLAIHMRWGDRQLNAAGPTPAPLSFAALGKQLLRDYRLVCFTLGGLLSAVVFGQFSAYLSQYLVVTTSAQDTYRIISTLVATNALLVIALQYAIGRRITQRHLSRWLALGLGLFLLGVSGFGLATSLALWVLSMVVFTLGEIIVFPAEYMFIDLIAPEHLRGLYYGAQNLSNLGGALGPILCGMLLASHPAHWIFYMLAAFIIAGGLFYWLGAANLESMRNTARSGT
ncbi:MFS transporter [Pseudomonas protegens]|uniref:MFS-type transporter YdeE n=1 Tax=Pseudomonas protegens (strain DSM 19095 / LMG 27888 / CFBP 6595 / CHA0) TaxID=1124983 RepID=A0A2C9ELQ6_PSEPH|nr:MFS transporter [Pseudomonas protegens]AGL84592.1 MFS-type transporter YdeE [Pseudomonas protegens CHA0]MBP5113327.1 MFS transporter [Pseudomonas protegens]QTU23972.1 MFS transporter [Pseudomonas protegens]QTU33503.1 MFS transporter [Pseudomonas protegens]RLO24014.1 MFS transporter [Pseudomonas protegens]